MISDKKLVTYNFTHFLYLHLIVFVKINKVTEKLFLKRF